MVVSLDSLIGKLVTAKHIGWNEVLTPEQEFDMDPYESETGDDLEGILTVLRTQPSRYIPALTLYLVNGQEADPATITTFAENTFCPTGLGGGVDPTCSPGEGSSSSLTDAQLDSRIKDTYEKVYSGKTVKGMKAKEKEALKQQYKEDVKEFDRRTQRKSGDRLHERLAEQNVLTQQRVAELSTRDDVVNPVQIHGMTAREEMRGLRQDWMEVVYSKEATGAAADSLADLKAIRADVPDKLWNATERIVFTSQKNKDDSYWAEKFSNSDHTAIASGGDGRIVVYKGNRLDLNTFAHESGHNLATKLWGTTDPPADSDFGRLQQVEQSTGRVTNGVTDYGRNSRSEDFAETVALYVNKGKAMHQSIKSPGKFLTGNDYLRLEHPERYRAIEEILK